MKLLHKINSKFLIASLSVLALMGLSLSIILNIIIDKQLDEKLYHSYKKIKKQIKKDTIIGSLKPYLEIKNINFKSDTIYYSEIRLCRHKDDIFKQLVGITTIKGKTYKITIRESQIESDDFYETIITIVLIAILCMLIILYLINQHISKTIWSTFYNNLNRVKNFSLQKLEKLEFKETPITEFNELNEVLTNLTSKVITDYQNLKLFLEDASHELQTPLAIIRSKIDFLINSNDLNPLQVEKINTINNTINHLTRLNKDLILLSKVENHQFEAKKLINLSGFVKTKIIEWQEILDLKKITIDTKYNHEIEVELNPYLAEILISNLLSNAINNTKSGSEIIIQIIENKLSIKNSGDNSIKDPESIFNRFYKEDQTQQSVGLGLAIAKKICETNQIHIEYSFSQMMHIFSLEFPLRISS